MKKIVFFVSLVLNLYSDISSAMAAEETNNLVRNSKQLTFVGTRSGEGYFSADGKKMIYQSEREEGNPFYQIFLLDLDTGKSTRLSTGQGMTTCGWIHPRLKKSMWSSTHLDSQIKQKVESEYAERAKPVKKRYAWSYDDQYDIFESDLNGKNIKRLTSELGYDAEGSYSPDGKWIAFASNRSLHSDSMTEEEKKIAAQDASYMMEIYIMKADGTGVKRLTNTRGYDGGPFFSADGKKITWRRFTPDGNRAEIYTMNVDGSEQRPVTALNALSWAPFFHPSGEYIIFATSVLGYSNFELFIVDTLGRGKPVRVTFNEGFDGLPSFSPDGNKLSWTRRNETGESQIYLADWDHTRARKLVASSIEAAPAPALSLSPEITSGDSAQIIKYLASAEMKGRMSGSEEEKIYTEEIAHLFKQWGLVPALGKSFVQNFEFTSSVTATEVNTLEMKGRFEAKLKRGTDYQLLSYSRSGEFNAAPLVFAGYGIKAPATDKLAAFDSYKNLDVKDKWVLLLDHLPQHTNKEMNQHLLMYSRPQHKITVAKNNQAAGVVFVSDVGLKSLKFEGSLSESSLPVIKISSAVFTQMLAKADAEFKNYPALEQAFSSLKNTDGFVLNSQYVAAKIGLEQHKSVGRNVVGRLVAGTQGKSAKAVIIGAHGDHLGKGEGINSSLARPDDKSDIHFGADDNASGVAGVLELAHYFSAAKNRKQLKKPLVFAIWSGEEIGVLGSSHFTRAWKAQTGQAISQNFEASLNMDMIGRLRDKLQVQGVGSAKEWPGLSEEVGLISGLPLVLTSDPYLPTDAMSLYLAEIPSISFTTGSHEEYHSPRDTFETINQAGLVKVIEAVRLFTTKLAHYTSEVVHYAQVSGSSGAGGGGGSRSFRIYLGTIPDYSQEGVKGVKISGSSKNSPAEKAGLKAGDVITDFDNINIENLYDYVYALQSAKAEKAVTLGILRDGQRLKLSIIPVLKE